MRLHIPPPQREGKPHECKPPTIRFGAPLPRFPSTRTLTFGLPATWKSLCWRFMQGFQPLRHPSDQRTTRFLACSPGYVRNGLDGNRTRCLLLARQALCRLSYGPIHCMMIPGEAKANYDARPNLYQRFAVPSPILSPHLLSFSSGVFFRLAPILFVVDAKPSENSIVFREKERFTTSTLWTTSCAIQSTYVTRNHHAARNFSLHLPAHRGSIRLFYNAAVALYNPYSHKNCIKDVT